MFNLQEYMSGELNPKLRYFLEYLETNFLEEIQMDDKFLELLNEDDFLNAFRDYIDKASPARQTAQTYIRNVRNFFEMLHDEYGIRNPVFYDNEINIKFEKMKASIILELREQENKECISDEEFEKLHVEMDKFLCTPDLEEKMIREIENHYSGVSQQNKFYSRFVSIVPIQLAMKFGLSNITLVNLKESDLDLPNGLLYVKGFQLPLTKALTDIMTIYCRMRTMIIEYSQSDIEDLFIKLDGKSFVSEKNNIPVYATFFFFMKECINTYACKRLSYKRIVELVDKGADIKTLSELVDVKPDTIRSICDVDSEGAKSTLINIIMEQYSEGAKKEPVSKGNMKCVYCGKVHTADSANWLLIQTDDSDCKYLACRECRGKDGKYRY